MERNQKKILPIGTVVYLKLTLKKVMIVGRKMIKEIGGEKFYFDYVACLYPEGVIGAEYVFINNEDIQAICYKGYEDEDNAILVKRYEEWEETTKILKGYREIIL
ncbi:MAG: DUF4176 domain-containing protein [Sarcina sp.]